MRDAKEAARRILSMDNAEIGLFSNHDPDIFRDVASYALRAQPPAAPEVVEMMERLRNRREFGLNGSTWMMLSEPDRDCRQAASLLERLAQQVATARANETEYVSQLDAMQFAINQAGFDQQKLRERSEAAEQQVAALTAERAAIIAKLDEREIACAGGTTNWTLLDRIEIATAAAVDDEDRKRANAAERRAAAVEDERLREAGAAGDCTDDHCAAPQPAPAAADWMREAAEELDGATAACRDREFDFEARIEVIAAILARRAPGKPHDAVPPVPEATNTRTRVDVTCPKTGEMIPLDKMSISKFSETIYRVWCPDCRAFHQFNTVKP